MFRISFLRPTYVHGREMKRIGYKIFLSRIVFLARLTEYASPSFELLFREYFHCVMRIVLLVVSQFDNTIGALPDGTLQLVLIQLNVFPAWLRDGVHPLGFSQGFPLHPWTRVGASVGGVRQIRKNGSNIGISTAAAASVYRALRRYGASTGALEHVRAGRLSERMGVDEAPELGRTFCGNWHLVGRESDKRLAPDMRRDSDPGRWIHGATPAGETASIVAAASAAASAPWSRRRVPLSFLREAQIFCGFND